MKKFISVKLIDYHDGDTTETDGLILSDRVVAIKDTDNPFFPMIKSSVYVDGIRGWLQSSETKEEILKKLNYK